MKKVLLITSNFPPSNKVGAIRPGKFAKYLPEFGWQPIVLTKPSEQSAHNMEICEMIPVYTAPAPTLNSLYSLGRNLFPTPAIVPTDTKENIAKEKEFSGRAEVINSWLFIPDKSVTWLPSAILRGLQIAKKYPIEVIFSTSPDPTCHLIAKFLSKKLRYPWIADFRDPWARYEFYFYPTRWHRKLNASLERSVVTKADRVITVTKNLYDGFIESYPDSAQNKFRLITNGCDLNELKEIEKTTLSHNENILKIVHNGNFFYSGKDPFPFLKALQLLNERGRVNKIKVDFVGVSPKQLQPTLIEWELSDTVNLIEATSHQESLRYLFMADILLLVSGPARNVLTAKVFEYLFSGKPILALTPHDGNLAQLLQQANVGYIADPESPEDIAKVLLRLIEDIRIKALPTPNWNFIQQFDYKVLTAQLAQTLNELV